MMSDQLETLIRQNFTGEQAAAFHPCAFFDDRLDCIRVIARDCSVVEERITDRITVLLDAYHPRPGEDGKQYVGFTIKGARHFCKEQRLPTGTIKLTALLDAVLKSSPEVVARLFVEHVAKPLVEEEHLDQVELQDGLVAST